MKSSERRLNVLNNHLVCKPNKEISISSNLCSSTSHNHNQRHSKEVVNSIPKKRQDLLKWNGWGYNDSKFVAKKGKDYYVSFTGNRYKIGNQILPHAASWVQETIGVDFTKFNSAKELPPKNHFPKPNINHEFLTAFKILQIDFSFDPEDRLFRSHGHTLAEIYQLRKCSFDRMPDLVVWPTSHDSVVDLVNLAHQHNVVLIPFGGGTSVTGGVLCPQEERRMVISLDTSQMSRILWVDYDNLTACIESGIIGQDLEKGLNDRGFTAGHEPDSYEFSSLGGWVATRASGMKKNKYGNIEDLVVSLKVATTRGAFERYSAGPRVSAGPDIFHFMMGSEGTLGVITEVVLKIQPLPPVRRYGSLVFSDFESALACMREVARLRCQPASIRLMDNLQFQFGHAMKPSSSLLSLFSDRIKKIYLTKIKGLDLNQIAVITLLFEGTESLVQNQERELYAISNKFGGIPAGEANGETGYNLTFVIAYIRDLGFDYGIVSESFETSVPWSRVADVCCNVKYKIRKECEERGIVRHFVSCRVTQTYDAGACIYFYFAFNYEGFDDPVHVYEEIENAARLEIIENGGSISHHHGVGKIRKQFMSYTIAPSGMGALKALKEYFDPKNVFACGNIF